MHTYQGDEHLSALLQRAQVSMDVSAIRALLKGVVAAPVGERPLAWTALLGGTLDVDTTQQLDALRHLIEASERERAAADVLRAQRVEALRAELAKSNVTGFLIPRADEHQGEYVPKRAERLSWLTGFTGSAGVAVVLRDKAAIFVDGRYTLQVGSEVDTQTFQVRHLIEQPLPQWLSENLKAGDVLGFDPWLHTRADLRKLTQALRKVNATLKPLPQNLVDAIWRGQPAAPIAPVEAQPEAFTGATSAQKRAQVASLLADEGQDALVISGPDVLAWLANIRGADVPFTPLPLGFAILHRSGDLDVFIEPRKLTPGLTQSLDKGVRVHEPQTFAGALRALGEAKKAVQMDEITGAVWIYDQLSQAGAQVRVAPDPCMKLKACKNEAEAAGTRAAHLRDGVAMTRFLCWLDGRLRSTEPLDELEASDQLHALRRQGERFRDLSFPSISGAGPNGAIVHYRATEATNRKLEPGNLYLIDSGAQYQDGTTDITRTIAVGEPTAEMRERFTLVLKGHIALSTAVFPVGTTGSQLDALARMPLWSRGLDYDHGTGHGVGSFLSVHEGPQRISKVPNTTALQPGMILSNEPGYYKTGGYGIRIENLVMVRQNPVEGSEREMLGFETLTLAPIDRRLVCLDLLTDAERAWLNNYHARVAREVGPLLDAQTQAWLREQTDPLTT